MEANICDVNHLDADVLLPPRKRLLAGLKKRGSDSDGSLLLSLPASLPASGSASTSMSASVPPPSLPSSSEFDIRLSNLLSSNGSNLSPVEVVEASKTAAAAAAKAAEAARAAADEKAALAAKAVAAAKRALDLVASFSEEAVCKERNLKKNKFKKHVPVRLLYKKYQPIENCKKDEELARKLHRAINSSPRISKNSCGSDWKGHKHKKPKITSSSEKTRDSNGGVVLEQTLASTRNGHAAAGEAGFGSPIQESRKNKVDENTSTYDRVGRTEIDNREVELGQPEDKTFDDMSTSGNGHAAAGEADFGSPIRESLKNKVDENTCTYDRVGRTKVDNGAELGLAKKKTWDDMSTSGKKRGRVKLKKLPLSACAFREQDNSKEEVLDIRKRLLTDMNMGNPPGANIPVFSVEPSGNSVTPLEAKSVWKCEEFKGPDYLKQNKVMQS